MRRILFRLAGAAWTVLLILGLSSRSLAQDTRHPRKMNLPSSSFMRPDPQDFRVTLDNGLVAYVVEEHQVPLVSLTALVAAGSADDAKEGAAEILHHVLKQAGPTGVAFRDALQEMVADYRVDMGPEVTKISLNVPTEDAGRALRLLAGLLKAPPISSAAVETLRVRSAKKTKASEPATGESGPVLYEGSLTSAVERFRSVLFADHPYGSTPGKEDFDKLSVEDVKRFHGTFFVPGNVVLAVSGDFDSEEIKSGLLENFADWQPAGVPKHQTAPALRTPQQRHIHTYPADKLQAWIVLGHELPRVPAEDEAALTAMNYILGGGHFDTRLFRETRDKRGLTNDASGFLEPGWRGPGSYTFRTYGRPEVIHLLVELVMKEIRRIRTEGVSEEELFVATGALADGVFQMWFENGHATALRFAEEWLRYRNHRDTETYVERIRAVTTQDVLAAAQKYLLPERMQMVLMGPIDEIQTSTFPEGELRLEDFGRMVAGK